MLAPMVLAGDTTLWWVNTAHQTPLSTSAKAPPRNPLGATGALPQLPQIGPDVLTKLSDPPVTEGSLIGLPNGPLGIPGAALSAYQRAQSILATRTPDCHLDWALLAGIGKIESNHARGGAVDAQGNTLAPILGPVLDGSGGFAAIPDTDNGVWDGDARWDRAVGPMQFIPSTWREYAAISNAKDYGQANPNNIFDAALAAGNYLCAGGGDMRNPAQRAAAVFNYNHSDSYVLTVLAWATAYATGVTTLPNDTAVPFVQPVPAAPFVGSTTPPSVTPTSPTATTEPTTAVTTTSSSATPTSTTTETTTSTPTSTTTTTVTTTATTTAATTTTAVTTTTVTTTTTTTPGCPTTTTVTTTSNSATPTSTTTTTAPGCPTPTTTSPATSTKAS